MAVNIFYPNDQTNYMHFKRHGVGGATFQSWNAGTIGDGVAAGSTSPFATNWAEVQCCNDNSGTPRYRCSRTSMAFDTSSLPDNTTIFSATLELFFQAPSDYDYFQAQNFSDARVWPLRIVEGTFPATGPLTNLSFGNIVKSNLIASGPSSDVVTLSTSKRKITINITNLSMINKTGYTRFFIIGNADYLVTAPAYNSSQLNLTMFNRPGGGGIVTDETPKLTVNHQVIDIPTITSFI